MSLREQIAARRAEVRASPARPKRGAPVPVAELEDKTVSGQISKAARSGKLDLASLSLVHIPHTVYTELLGLPEEELSRPPVKEAPPQHIVPKRIDALSFDETEENKHNVFGTPPPKARWREPEELTSFRAGYNMIKEVDVELGLFGGLKTLDLHGNQLSSLPDSIADLLQLQHIDLSQNAFTTLPSSLLLLPELESISLANNAVATFDLSSPIKPSQEGLSYGTGFLITSFERQEKMPKFPLPALRTLNLAHNSVTVDALSGLAGKNPLKLRIITLSNNQLAGTLDLDAAGLGPQRLPELQTLILSENKGLQGVTGDLTAGATVDTEGCGYDASGAGTGSAGRTPEASPRTSPRKSGAGPAAAVEPDYVPAAGGPDDVPQPSATFDFITHPAATFDSEPLALQLDVYLPRDADPTKAHPVVIWWHGGGLLQGNKENMPPHLRRLPSHAVNGERVITVSPNYRLSPQAPILDVLADVDAAISFVRTKLNDRLAAKSHAARVDPDRIVLSGGSAGGYLALMAGLPVPQRASEQDLGGYRGASTPNWKPLGIAPFYPITDLEHEFWATKTDPVPWWGTSVPDAAAQPHLNIRDAPVGTAESGGPRSILYPYMLQHALFPRLLFMNQRSRGQGLDSYRPTPASLSVTKRLGALAHNEIPRPSVYIAYGTKDDKIQPLDESVELLRQVKGDLVVEVIPGADHAYDEAAGEQCEGFVHWLEGVLLK